jgi:hypothetical protein
MSLTLATLIPGLILLTLGVPLLLGNSLFGAVLKSFPRSTAAAYVFFGTGAAWFLYNIWHLSMADMGEYRNILFGGFLIVAVAAFKCVPDFLSVRGLCALMLLAATPPAVVKEPPATRSPLGSTASADTGLFIPDPSGDHDEPFQRAM